MAVDPAKDVDGFHPVNVGFLSTQRPGLVPCTPAGIMEILKRSNIPVAGQEAVVVGRSDIVGKPTAMLLINANATVTVCHSKTRDLPGVCRRADILVAAIGRAGMITRDFVKPGATVIDVGMNKVTERAEFDRLVCGQREAGGELPDERVNAGGGRSSQRSRSCRSDHARARRRGPADHRHADGQHRQGGEDAEGLAHARTGRRSTPAVLKVGLTGGIAAGKSVVGEMFAALGAHVIQADEIAHQLMQPGEAVYREVVDHFGAGILDPDGSVNRARLAELAFGGPDQPSRVQELNQIVHPAVIRRQEEWMAEVGRRDPHAIAMVEAALILEAGMAEALRPSGGRDLPPGAADRALGPAPEGGPGNGAPRSHAPHGGPASG